MEKKKENKVLKSLGSLDIYVASIIMLVLLGITVVNVFMRYVMRSPITWVDELQLFLFLWIVYLSAGAAFRHSFSISSAMRRISHWARLQHRRLKKCRSSLAFIVMTRVVGTACGVMYQASSQGIPASTIRWYKFMTSSMRLPASV